MTSVLLLVDMIQEALTIQDKPVLYANSFHNRKVYVDSKAQPPGSWGTFRFIVIENKEDPVHLFWLLRKENVLASDACIVFTDVQDSPAWQDLEQTYQGVRFGSLFLMRYNGNTEPGILPSQRGMYMK